MMRKSLRCERGSVLIAGLFMGIILVLCCLHTIGVTEAILRRALGQNIADAVALEGAVWHAQGMNLIVLINLIMAGVLALFITIRLVQLIMITLIAMLMVAAVVASLIPFGVGAGAAAGLRTAAQAVGRGLVRVQRTEDKVSEPVMKTLQYGAEAERLLAAVMPYVSLARPITRSNDLPGVVVGVSLIPAVLEQKFSKAPQIPIANKPHVGPFEPETSFPARMGTLPLGPHLNARLKKLDANVTSKRGLPSGTVIELVDLAKGVVGSLPVQEEDAYQLCGRAGEMVVTFFPSIAQLDDAMLEKVGAFAGVVFGSLQTMTCTPLKSLGSKAENALRDAVDKKCTEEEDEELGMGIAQMQGDKPYWDDKKRKKCREDKLKDAKKGSKEWSDPTNFDDLKVARLWGIIAEPKNSPWLHVWSIVPLSKGAAKSGFYVSMERLFPWAMNDVGVTGLPANAKDDVEPANAMGEFRHVCDGGSDPAGRGCGENSMWRPGWYAKLVPVRDITDEIRQKFGDALAGWFSRALGKFIVGATDKFINHFLPFASKPVIDKYQRHLGIMLSQRMMNNWFVRRYVTDQVTQRTKIANIELLTSTHYPEHLH